MKLSRTLRTIIKQEGRDSITAKTVVKLKNSKEFDYLINIKR